MEKKQQDREILVAKAIFNRDYFTENLKDYQKEYAENKGILGNIKKVLGMYKLPKEEIDFLDSTIKVNEWVETGNGDVLEYLQNIDSYFPEKIIDDTLHLKRPGLEDILKQRMNEIKKSSQEIEMNGNHSRLEYFEQVSIADVLSGALKGSEEFEENTRFTYNDFISAHYRADSIFDAYTDLGLEIPVTIAKEELIKFLGVYTKILGNKGIHPDLQKEMKESFLEFNNKVETVAKSILISQ